LTWLRFGSCSDYTDATARISEQHRQYITTSFLDAIKHLIQHGSLLGLELEDFSSEAFSPAALLCPSLLRNTSVHTLALTNTAVGAVGAAALVSLLRESVSLTALDLREATALSDESTLEIATAVLTSRLHEFSTLDLVSLRADQLHQIVYFGNEDGLDGDYPFVRLSSFEPRCDNEQHLFTFPQPLASQGPIEAFVLANFVTTTTFMTKLEVLYCSLSGSTNQNAVNPGLQALLTALRANLSLT
jgi:hypothetical protein